MIFGCAQSTFCLRRLRWVSSQTYPVSENSCFSHIFFLMIIINALSKLQWNLHFSSQSNVSVLAAEARAVYRQERSPPFDSLAWPPHPHSGIYWQRSNTRNQPIPNTQLLHGMHSTSLFGKSGLLFPTLQARKL